MNRSYLGFLAASGYTAGNCGAVARALHHETEISVSVSRI